MQQTSWGQEVPGGLRLDYKEGTLPAALPLPARQGETDLPASPVAKFEMSDEWERLWIDLGGEG